MATVDDLAKQILAQNTTSKWTGQGFGSAEANARDMAKILSSIGITDIKQFGLIEVPDKYVGLTPRYNARNEIVGYTSQKDGSDVPLNKARLSDDGGWIAPLTTYGNKVTGQAVPKTYSERQTGNAWGGTFAGDGNTGYRVNFAADGTPIFYTTGASSSDDLAPILAIAGLALGAPYLSGIFGGATAAAGLTAAEAAGLGLTAAEAAAAGLSATEFAAAAGTGLLGSGTGAMTAAELAQLDLALGGAGGSAGAAELGAALSTGAPTITSTALTGGSGTVGAPASTTFNPLKGLTASDAIRAASIISTIAGANEALSSGGSDGFSIVPVPADWKSPPPTSVAQFTPLAPIDFGNKQMLRGTQWERLLDPNYGQTPVMPTFTNPSKMSFEELTRILGNSRESIPTQNLSINDVIAGIQSQYGQAPQGSMG